ncbi:MAG: FHA domain-containing protein [Planctomycetes bacterium]|nr:FHA domain-containing protein [Planctomycetota bacterium]
MPVRATSPTPADRRSALVTGGAHGGMRVRLVRNGDDATEPFVVVHAGRFARIVLAETVLGDGSAGQRFALKLRIDHVGGDRPPGNADLDRQWQQERRELARVRSPHVVAPLPVPDSLLRSPPVFHCRRVDRYFHPVCPETLASLVVCRDDARLAQAGLPPYATDTERYLHAAAGEATRFYRAGDEPGQGAVRGPRELVRSWRALVHGEAPVELPCQRCEHRGECFPDGDGGALPAERYLHAVSFYDVDALALELAAMPFEEAILRLGGGAEPGADERRWLGGAAGASRALEVLRLKLAAFADVCRGVAAVHESGRPHLGVSPQNVVVYEARAGSAIAANWRLRFAVTDLGGAIPVEVPGGDVTLWQPGREVSEDATSRLFLSPALRSLEGGSVTMSVRCTEVSGSDGARQVLEVHRAGVPPFVLPGDFVLVQPAAGGPSRGARIDEVGSRGLFATVLRHESESATSVPGTQVMKRPTMPPFGSAASPPAAAAGGAAVDVGWAGKTFDARLQFVRRSGPSADLYGLGMLLLRILLVHDEQPLDAVAATVEHCLQRMTVAAQHAGEHADLAAQWQHILDGEDGEGRFAAWHVLQRRSARQALFDAELQGTPVVPRAVWRGLLALAGRLLLAPPVSRAAEGRSPSRPLDGVLAELHALERELDVELFGRDARDRMLTTLCTQRVVALRGELASSDGEAPRGGALRGFVLAVGRIGESNIDQHHFVQDRVTIGRREEDNTLVLVDPMVSSKHAVIELDGGEYVLFDRGSTNGTEVDGIRLPVEVPHPLDDGSVIHIRPFVLSFRRASSVALQTTEAPKVTADDLFDELRSAYAEHLEGGDAAAAAAVGEVLDRARKKLGRRVLLTQLEAVCRRLPVSPEALSAVGGAPAAQAGSPLATAALRTMQQLARNLLADGELDTAAAVQEFGGRVQRFVEVTSRWVESMLDWRSVLGQQLDLRSTSTGAGRPTLRSAREVQESMLRPTGDDSAAIAERFLARFLDDVLGLLEGLLLGNQRMRSAVREQLAPERLVEAAGKEAKLRILVQATAGSALWKLFEETYRSLTAPDAREAELQRLLQVATERRRERDA